MGHDRDTRLKCLRYRAGHRGTRELDLLLGRYANAHLDGMTDEQLDAFEAVLALPDPIIASWIYSHDGTSVDAIVEILMEQYRIKC